jgi:hypothetical protein
MRKNRFLYGIVIFFSFIITLIVIGIKSGPKEVLIKGKVEMKFPSEWSLGIKTKKGSEVIKVEDNLYYNSKIGDSITLIIKR